MATKKTDERVYYFKRGELTHRAGEKRRRSAAGWWFTSSEDAEGTSLCGPYPTEDSAREAMKAHDKILAPFQYAHR